MFKYLSGILIVLLESIPGISYGEQHDFEKNEHDVYWKDQNIQERISFQFRR